MSWFAIIEGVDEVYWLANYALEFNDKRILALKFNG